MRASLRHAFAVRALESTLPADRRNVGRHMLALSTYLGHSSTAETYCHAVLGMTVHRAVVLVHGCFWHRHAGCRYATAPKTRAEFWKKKFAANVSRDAAVHEKLTRKGWRVATVWECAMQNPDALTQTAEMVAIWLKSDEPGMELGELQVEPQLGIATPGRCCCSVNMLAASGSVAVP